MSAPVLPHPKLLKNDPLRPVALPARMASASLAEMPGAPPGIRTRISMFLRHARIPIPPAGHENKKARTPHGELRALEKKKPGALSRSGLGVVSALALAFLRFRTRAVLADFPAIQYEALPARWQGLASRIYQFHSVFHVFLNARGGAFCARDFSKSTGKN